MMPPQEPIVTTLPPIATTPMPHENAHEDEFDYLVEYSPEEAQQDKQDEQELGDEEEEDANSEEVE